MGKPRKSTAGSSVNNNSEDDLHAAARNGNLNAVQTILTSNPLAVNTRDKHSRTPLHLAAWSGHTDVVSYLCKHKADVGAAAMDDMGAIHFAAQKGHLEVVRTLYTSGGNIKAFTRKGFTPLHYAVQGSHIELIKYMVKKGASLTAKTKTGKTPLDLASNDDIRLFLEECEKSANKGGKSREEKGNDSESKSSLPKGQEDDGVHSSEGNDDAVGDDKAKRKADENDARETLTEAKKPKVVLSHILSGDDTQEEEA